MSISIYASNGIFNGLTYKNSCVYLNGEKYATYTHDSVTEVKSGKTIGKMTFKNCTLSSYNYYMVPCIIVAKENGTIIDGETNKVLATFTDNSFGAMAAYISWQYNEYLKQMIASKKKSSAPETPKAKVAKSEPKVKVEVPKEPHKYEPRPEYELNKKDYEKDCIKYKKNLPKYNNVRLPRISFGAIVAIIIIIFFVIKVIPWAWDTITEDSGSMTCFGFPLGGAIIGAIYCLLSDKEPEGCFAIFGIACLAAFVINAIQLLNDVYTTGPFFTDSVIIDTVLCFFAPAVGVLVYAIPIGIVLFILYLMFK